MKILLVGYPYLIENQQPKLRAIANRGVHLNVLAPSNWRFPGPAFEVGVHDPSTGPGEFGFIPGRVFRPGHIASHCFSPLTVWQALNAVRPELVHIENDGYSYLAGQIVPIARSLGIKTTLFAWENTDKPMHWTQRACLKISLPITNGLVCGSASALTQYRRWGFRGATAVVPQFGVDIDVSRAMERHRNGGPFVIGYVGRLVPEKGVDLLLRAVRRLVDQKVDIRCIVCGSGNSQDHLAELARSLAIEAVTSFPGAVPHHRVAQVLRQLDVLVLPSRTTPAWAEQLGHILLEAMSEGTAVVGARSGAIPEVIARDDLLFDENDWEGLAAVLLPLATNRQLLDDARAFGTSRIETNYRHEVIADALIDFWRSIMYARP